MNYTTHLSNKATTGNSLLCRVYPLHTLKEVKKMTNQDNINIILKFMPQSQAQCFIQGLKDNEQSYFKGVADKIANVIQQTDKGIVQSQLFITSMAMLTST